MRLNASGGTRGRLWRPAGLQLRRHRYENLRRASLDVDPCGAVGISVEKPDDIRPALERALAAGKPCVVEVAVDPNEPPMPPKVNLEQAMHFAEALVKGQPEGGKIALTLFRDKMSELVRS
jgi:hypothetical protein